MGYMVGKFEGLVVPAMTESKTQYQDASLSVSTLLSYLPVLSSGVLCPGDG